MHACRVEERSARLQVSEMKLVYNVCLLLTCVPLEAEISLIRARPWTVPVTREREP